MKNIEKFSKPSCGSKKIFGFFLFTLFKSQVALECSFLVLYPLHQNIKRWNSCVVLRNCRLTTGNPESKYLGGHFVFYRSKKYSKLSDLGPIVSGKNVDFSWIS